MHHRFDVFGRAVIVVRRDHRWCAYYAGSEGKRRPASDIVIPADLEAQALAQYLDDLCHEWASPAHPKVVQIA